MMTKRRILLFYPHNFYEMSSGTHRRVYNLLVYLRERGFSVDLLSISGFSNRWGKEDLERRDLLDYIGICNWQPSFIERLKMWLQWKGGRLPDLATHQMRREFKKMISDGDYTFVIVSYVYWASLVNIIDQDVIKVIDLHDVITLNEYMRQEKGEFRLGKMFEDEVRAIGRFEYALSISEEETLILTPFCPHTDFVDAPISFPKKFQDAEEYLYDILFVGSENPFNRKGMEWFMEGVYSLLPSNVRIAVIGKISQYVESKDNITLISYADDLDEIYKKSKMICCPLRSGTGLKVKVVEALSYGKPVVTTSWGLTGILQKRNNGCLLADREDEFAGAINLLLINDMVYKRLKKEAEDFFISNYSTDIVYKKLDAVFT